MKQLISQLYCNMDRSPVTNRTHSVSSKVIAQQYFERADSFVFGRFWLSVRTPAFTDPHLHHCVHGATFSDAAFSRLAFYSDAWPTVAYTGRAKRSKSRTLR